MHYYTIYCPHMFATCQNNLFVHSTVLQFWKVTPPPQTWQGSKQHQNNFPLACSAVWCLASHTLFQPKKSIFKPRGNNSKDVCIFPLSF